MENYKKGESVSMDNDIRKQMKQYEEDTGIKQLSLNARKSSVIFTRSEQQYDRETGEVINREDTSIKKFKSLNEFVQVYLENMNFMLQLSPIPLKILVGLIGKMDYYNVINIHSDLRISMQHYLNLGRSSVYAGIKELIDKKFLIPIESEELKREYSAYGKNFYLVNPNIVGKGSFRELEKLRQTIVREYDVDKLEMKTTVVTDFDYGLVNELYNKEHEVIGITENKDEAGNKSREIYIAEKNEKSDEYIDTEIKEENIEDEKKQKHTEKENSLFTEYELSNTKEEKENNESTADIDYNQTDSVNAAIELERIKINKLKLELRKIELEIQNKLISSGHIKEALEGLKNIIAQ